MMVLLGALALLLPVGTRKILGHVGVPAYEWNAIFIALTDLFLLALIGWGIASRRLRQMLQPIDPGIILLVLFLAAVGCSVAWHGFDALSLFRYAKLLAFAAFAIFVRQAFRGKKGNLLLALFVLAAVLESMLAVGQFFAQRDFGLQILGESPLDSRAAGIAKIDVGNVKILRAYGTFPHPNILAAYLAAALFAVLALSQTTPVWLAAVFPLMLALFTTFSRAAFAALILGIAIAVVFGWRHRYSLSAHARKVSIGFLYALSVSGLLYAALFFPFWRSRAIPRAAEGAVVERVFYADAAIRMIRAHPIFGAGWGGFSDRLAEYVEQKPVRVPSVSFPLWLLQPVHNMYLLIAAEAGIGALIFFFSFAGALVVRAMRARDAAAAPFLAGFLVLLVAGFFDHFPFTSQQGALLFWFIAGILLAAERR